MDKLELSFATPLRIVVEASEPAGAAAFLTIWNGPFLIRAKGDVMYTMPILHAVEMRVSYVDAAGNPAEVDGPVVWETSDAAIVNVETDADDSAHCVVTSTGKVGQAQVIASADADLGEGVRKLVTICDISVLAGEAVAGTIEPDSPAQPIGPQPVG